jgi:2-isopropylmalate synthase
MDPKQMGIPRSMIILGKHSGRHALKHRAAQYGVTLDQEQLEDVYTRFKAVAETQKVIGEKAIGEAEVTVTAGDQSFKGTGMDQDILLAVAKAYLAACNQAVRSSEKQEVQAI